VIAGLLVTLLAAGCVQDGQQGRTRADSYQRANPREALGSPGGDVGNPPRDMPGKGRGSETPRGK
jgi:hypothetical protein